MQLQQLKKPSKQPKQMHIKKTPKKKETEKEKSKNFIWRCVHNSIEVKACLARRGIGDKDVCSICRSEIKTFI